MQEYLFFRVRVTGTPGPRVWLAWSDSLARAARLPNLKLRRGRLQCAAATAAVVPVPECYGPTVNRLSPNADSERDNPVKQTFQRPIVPVVFRTSLVSITWKWLNSLAACGFKFDSESSAAGRCQCPAPEKAIPDVWWNRNWVWEFTPSF